jgi:hypothetical protein
MKKIQKRKKQIIQNLQEGSRDEKINTKQKEMKEGRKT